MCRKGIKGGRWPESKRNGSKEEFRNRLPVIVGPGEATGGASGQWKKRKERNASHSQAHRLRELNTKIEEIAMRTVKQRIKTKEMREARERAERERENRIHKDIRICLACAFLIAEWRIAKFVHGTLRASLPLRCAAECRKSICR